MKFEKISQEDREKLERRLYKTIVEEFRREKIKDGYYKYIVSLQEFNVQKNFSWQSFEHVLLRHELIHEQ